MALPHGTRPSLDEAQLDRLLPTLTPQSGNAFDVLFAGLGHQHWRYRQMALAALPRFAGHAWLLPRLIASLAADDNIGLRNACIHALVQQGEHAVGALVEVLARPDSGEHKFVAEALGQIGGTTARDGLLKSLDHPDTMTQAAVVEALGTIGGDVVTQELVRRLNHQSNDPQRTLFILDALGRSRAKLPVAVLLPFAKERVLARVAYRLLGTCGQIAATPTLVAGILGGSSGTGRIALHGLAELWRQQHSKIEIAAALDTCERGTRERLATKIDDLLGEQDREVLRDALLLAQYVSVASIAPRVLEVGMARGLAEVARQTVLALGPAAEAPLRAALDKVDGETYTFILDLLGALRPGTLTPMATATPKRTTPPLASLAPRGAVESVTMSDDQFARVADIVSAHCGIILPENMKVFIEHRLLARLEALNLETFAAYLALLRHEGPQAREIDELVELIVTKETFFFRERPQLRALTEQIIPEMLRKHPQQLVRIWCAGCSTGEEPYTLAMLLDKSKLWAQGNFEIFASDISRKALRQAKAGVYRKFSLRDTTPEDAQRYFVEDGALYTLDESIRKRVGFGWVNLMDEASSSFLSNVDVILCRNVMIYFSNGHRSLLLRNLYKRMRPGGILLLGHSESLINVSSDFDVLPIKGDIVYRKPGGL